MKKKIVYIAHPISGDIKGNIKKVEDVFKTLSLENKVIPFAPYLNALSVLNDNIPEHRKIGFEQNRIFFERGVIDEMWVYGVSNGVNEEIKWCKEFNIKIVIK